MTLYRTPQHSVSRKLARFALATPLLVSLMACSQTPAVESKVIDDNKVAQIQQTIAEKYPNADAELQHHILDVAIKAIDNMVFIEGGSFMMGDFGMPCEMDNLFLAEWNPNVKCASNINSQRYGTINLHKVTLSNYSLAKFETTYYDMNAYRLAHQLPLINAGFNHNALKIPTPTKTWQEAKDYCTWLEGITNYPFDLPTEAQWEYAARNRGQNIYYATNDGHIKREGGGRYIRDNNNQRVWKDWPADEWNYPRAGDAFNDVGRWPPSPLGIYDLSNNATEWVNDWFSADYYANSPEQDPQGPSTGTHKVQRGWQDDRPIVTARYIGEDKDKYYPMYSFRCALQQKTPL
ncbi:MAG: formylglycine-generating enzyme family protein [Marinomonas foliarum]